MKYYIGISFLLLSGATLLPSGAYAADPTPVNDQITAAAKSIASGQPKDAITTLSAITKSPGAPSVAYRYLALAYIAVKDSKDAIEAAKTAVKLTPTTDPDYATNQLLLGNAYLNNYGDVSSAFRAKYTAGDQLLMQQASHTQTGPNGATFTDEDTDKKQELNDNVQHIRDEADLETEILGNSIAAYKKASDSDKSLGVVHSQLGMIYLIQSNLKDARNEITSDIKISGASPQALDYLGELDETGGDTNAAIADYTKALSLDPENAHAYHDLDRAYKKAGKPALQAWAHAMSLATSGDFQGAKAAFDTAGDTTPGILRGRGITALLNGDNDSALTYFNKAVTFDPNDSVSLTYLGDIYSLQSKPDDAIKSYKAAIAANPNNDLAFTGLGLVHQGLSQSDNALADYQSALNINPRSQTALLQSANLSAQGKDYKSAVKFLTTYLELYPLESNEMDVEQALADAKSKI